MRDHERRITHIEEVRARKAERERQREELVLPSYIQEYLDARGLRFEGTDTGEFLGDTVWRNLLRRWSEEVRPGRIQGMSFLDGGDSAS